VRFVGWDEVAALFHGKSVAIVGSAPSVLENRLGVISGHDLVVRVNNYKLGPAQGFRCDVHYSFYGTSIRKPVADLKRDGVTLCMCKLPDAKPLDSEWHERHRKLAGIDYRYIYNNRSPWWFCDTFIPTIARFMKKFELLGKHQPTTGFAAILDVLECAPRSVYLTGYDFFSSGVHNVDEPWSERNLDDPIRHRPDLEAAWLRENRERYPLTFDNKLAALLA
jgi:hypothetical protein